MREIGIGLIGFGTVGSGVAQILDEQGLTIERRTGMRPRLICAARRHWPATAPAHAPAERLTDVLAVVRDPRVQLVIEVMGGTDLALTAIEEALRLGKPVVTANKAVLSVHGNRIFALSESTATPIRFEASVAGAIPVIRGLLESLAGDHVDRIGGILNGTCNYILTEMWRRRVDFGLVLAEAQAKGYAEADPSADVDGWDTAHKVSVLTRLAFETAVDVQSLGVRGIRDITLQDMEAAHELGCTIRLLGMLERQGDKLAVRVEPNLVELEHPLAAVLGAHNGVQTRSAYAGDLLWMGRGAGQLPTANSVVSDVLSLLGWPEHRIHGPSLGYSVATQKPLSVTPVLTRPYYLRVMVPNKPGTLAEITGLCAKAGINISSLLQHERHHQSEPWASVVLTTSPVANTEIETLCRSLGPLAHPHEPVRAYPMLLTPR